MITPAYRFSYYCLHIFPYIPDLGSQLSKQYFLLNISKLPPNQTHYPLHLYSYKKKTPKTHNPGPLQIMVISCQFYLLNISPLPNHDNILSLSPMNMGHTVLVLSSTCCHYHSLSLRLLHNNHLTSFCSLLPSNLCR